MSPDLTWQRIVQLCPQVATLIAEAERARAQRKPADNPWLDYEHFKRRMTRLVGYGYVGHGVPIDAELRTSRAYDIVLNQILSALGL